MGSLDSSVPARKESGGQPSAISGQLVSRHAATCVCGGKKKVWRPLCENCYFWLPVRLQRPLWARVADQAAAYEAAVKYLVSIGKLSVRGDQAE